LRRGIVRRPFSVERPPDGIEVGLAVILAVGAPPLAVGVPPTPCHPNCDPAPVGRTCEAMTGNAIGVPFKSALTQFTILQVSI
jgi:hypothetical protein